MQTQTDVPAIRVKAPALPESITEAVLLVWHKHSGERVKEGDKLAELETDKIVLEVIAPQGGVLTVLASAGSTVKSEEVLAEIQPGDAAATPPVATPPAEPVEAGQAPAAGASALPASASSASADAIPPKTSPSARRLAAQEGVDIQQVKHGGERVTSEDVRQHLQAPPKPAEAPKPAPIQPEPPAAAILTAIEASSGGGRPQQRAPMTQLRRRAAERLLRAQHEHAILTTFNEINMKAMMDLRARYKESFEKAHGIKLGMMSFFVKAAVAALQRFPVVNASIEGQEVVYHGFYDIGIAVSSPRGLVVPVLRNADSLSFAEVEKAIADFGKRANSAALTLQDLDGGTFTITNGGIFGSMMSTPILNPPQSAILGMHNIVDRPVAENGQVVIRPMMYVALSYDHRLIDGRDAVQFLVAIKQAIEDPARLLLGV